MPDTSREATKPRVVPAVPSKGHPVALPVRVSEHRFFVTPKTRDGRTMVLYTDTGGGLFVSEQTVERFGLEVTKVEADGGVTDAAALPDFAPTASIPAFQALGGRLPVIPDAKAQMFGPVDGLLGQAWFRDRVWTFDYPGKRLLWRAPDDLPPHDTRHRVTLGFPTNKNGQRGSSYPRIQISVENVVIDLLFDTGATVNLSASAVAALNDGRPPLRATSFISASTFAGWKTRHPDWRVIESADQTVAGEPMIQVPQIEVAGFTVGPVWFTRRPDDNFHQWMSQWMDKQIDGALGGSALQYFKVTVDYPNAVAVFERL